MLHLIKQTCCRCSLQTQTGTRIHNLNRPILERTDEAVWRWGKCNWDWTATELKAPFLLKIPLLLGRHICASTWFREWLRGQACYKATKPSLGPFGVQSYSLYADPNSYPEGLNAQGRNAFDVLLCHKQSKKILHSRDHERSTILQVIYYSNLVQLILRGVVQRGAKGQVCPVTNHEPSFLQITNHVYVLHYFTNHLF